MGVRFYLLMQSLLRGEKSSLVLKQKSLTLQLSADRRKSSDFSRMISDKRRMMQSEWTNFSQSQMMSNAQASNLYGATSIFQCSQTYNLQNNPFYQQYQMNLEDLKREEEEYMRIAKMEEDDLMRQLDEVKTDLQLVQQEIEAMDEGRKNAIKEEKPEYC